jgi:zinc carboxypeptidase
MLPRAFHQLLAVLVVATATVIAPSPGRAEVQGNLDQFRTTVEPAVAARLVEEGYDVVSSRPAPDGVDIELVLSPAERLHLAATGLRLERWRSPAGATLDQLMEEQRVSPPRVFRSWEEPGGIEDELIALAQAHPELVTLSVPGYSVKGRPIMALRVTAGAPRVPEGSRPSVLYLSLQHAREWITGEVTRRLLHSLIDGYGKDPEVTELVDTRELWFVVVANPDGYEHTFHGDRLWRKNLADNDGDGVITTLDGVDLNRNLPDHFGFDDEGSSPKRESQTYRGPGPTSEPESRALANLLSRVRFSFVVNYHSYGNLLLYPVGWQVQTPSADHPVYKALAGTATNPAVPGYHPGLSAELYVTNGETAAQTHDVYGALAFTLELGEGVPGSGFLFPDNEVVISQEYEINRPFALDVARSAARPAEPQSHLRTSAPPLVIDTFDVSHGDPQPVEVTAARHLGPVTLRYQVNGGPVRSAPTAEWEGGRRFGAGGDVAYHVVRGQVTGALPSDRVEVWAEAGGKRSPSFTYRVERTSGGEVLVVVAGDHTAPRAGPRTTAKAAIPDPLAPPGGEGGGEGGRDRDAVAHALATAGIPADVYEVESHGRQAPHLLGVLGHYRAVIYVTDESRPPDVPKTVSRLANDEALALRAYLNEGGRLLYTGRSAGRPYARGDEYDPVSDGPCNPKDRGEDGCVNLSDDFFQYWLGAYELIEGGGASPDGGIAPVDGVDIPFFPLGWTFAAPGVAPGRTANAFRATSEVLDAAGHPQFKSSSSARYRPGAPNPPTSAVPAGGAITTADTILFGFGFGDIDGPTQRAAVMARAMSYLLRPQ